MPAAPSRTLLADAHRYIAHPHMAVLATGRWLLVANRGPRRAVTMHPPQDPEFTNVLLHSDDEGATWSAPVVVPGYGCTGTECAGLTALPDGGVLLNQWRFRWYPWGAAPADEPLLAGPAALHAGLAASSELDGIADDAPPEWAMPERVMPWARGGGGLRVHRSDDGGASFDAGGPVDTAPYAGGYGMRGAVVLDDGDIVLPLSDVPHYAQTFVVRSSDGGRNWSAPVAMAAADGCEYEEPAPILLPGGGIVMLLRENVSRSLHAVHSGDGGQSWSAPRPTGIAGYPAHGLRLADGRLAAVVGWRRPPFGIAAFVSHDAGRHWDVENPVWVAAPLPNKDLGYPTCAPCADGSLFVAWYHRDAAGITGLHATRLSL